MAQFSLMWSLECIRPFDVVVFSIFTSLFALSSGETLILNKSASSRCRFVQNCICLIKFQTIETLRDVESVLENCLICLPTAKSLPYAYSSTVSRPRDRLFGIGITKNIPYSRYFLRGGCFRCCPANTNI